MKVFILGCGAVGRVVSKLLENEKGISRVFCCDIKIQEESREGKTTFKKIDASNKEDLMKTLREIKPDLLVNTLIPKFNSSVLECCLLTKTNYIDTASYWGVDTAPNAKSPYKIEQFDYDEKFRENKITGLINSGVSPGLTNLMAKEASEKLDKTDFIKIRIIEDTRSEKLYFPWCVEWLLDEIYSEPVVYRNGKFKLVKRFSEEESFNFPEPFGKKGICLFCQEEVATIPLYIKAKNVDIKGYDSQGEMSKFLIKLGLASDKKIEIENTKISPRKFLARLLETDVKSIPEKWEIANAQFGAVSIAEGKKNKVRKAVAYSAVFPKEKEIDRLNLNANFISYPTALMLKMFITAFPRIKEFGVFSPEKLSKEIRTDILKNLVKAGIKINISESRIKKAG